MTSNADHCIAFHPREAGVEVSFQPLEQRREENRLCARNLGQVEAGVARDGQQFAEWNYEVGRAGIHRNSGS